MLSRIADAMLWIGRYVERADQTARILDVRLQAITEDVGRGAAGDLAEVLALFGARPTADAGRAPDVQGVLDRMVADRENPSAVAGSLRIARENARGAREVLPTEVWEALNTTAMNMPRSISPSRMHDVFRVAKDRCAVIGGLVDSTMTRDEAWLFLVIGRMVERIDMTARLLAAHDREDTSEQACVQLLRCAGGWEAYIRTYRGLIASDDVLAFLLLDSASPRSVAHCLHELDRALAVLSRLHGRALDRLGTEDPTRRIVGRALASLRHRSYEEIAADFAAEMERLQLVTAAATRSLASTYLHAEA
ncbi:alpha-E domain-containing protein [Brachybacterium sp. DNPG3]